MEIFSVDKIVMGINTIWEGIYKVKRDSVEGYLEVHEWSDWFDDEELEDDNEPDGAWYCEYRLDDLIDGGVCGYKYGDTFEDLEYFLGLTIIECVARPCDDNYDELNDWINGETRCP